VRLAAFTLLFGAVLATWFAKESTRPQVAAFQQDSEALVRGTVVRAAERGVRFAGGFMVREDGTPYTSQVGLQYQVLAALAPAAPEATLPFLDGARFAVATLFALVLGLFLADVAERWGRTPAMVALALVMGSHWLSSFSLNLYWMIFLHFLPFVLTWTLHDRVQGGPRVALVAAVGLAVLVKCLCGYEYVTNVVAAPAVAVLVRELERGEPLRRALRAGVPYVAAGLAGFAVAGAAHVAQAWIASGSARAGMAALVGPALYRTTGDILGREIHLGDDLLRWLKYLTRPVVRGIRETVVIAAAVAAGVALARLFGKGDPRGRSLVLGLVAAGVVSLSWNVLAWGHMRYHLHINPVTFFLPFNLVAFAAIPRAAALLLRRRTATRA
jgi:hypothetical protein